MKAVEIARKLNRLLVKRAMVASSLARLNKKLKNKRSGKVYQRTD